MGVVAQMEGLSVQDPAHLIQNQPCSLEIQMEREWLMLK